MSKTANELLIDYRCSKVDEDDGLDFSELLKIKKQLDSGDEYIQVKASEYIANMEALKDERDFIMKEYDKVINKENK